MVSIVLTEDDKYLFGSDKRGPIKQWFISDFSLFKNNGKASLDYIGKLVV